MSFRADQFDPRYFQTSAGSGEVGGGGGGAPAGGGAAPPSPGPSIIEVVQQAPGLAGLGTIAILSLLGLASLIQQLRENRSTSSRWKKATKRPALRWKQPKNPKK